ncbi:MAG TPA: hypothetical protein VF278_17535, partial [Pirellulales bacterium]
SPGGLGTACDTRVAAPVQTAPAKSLCVWGKTELRKRIDRHRRQREQYKNALIGRDQFAPLALGKPHIQAIIGGLMIPFRSARVSAWPISTMNVVGAKSS